MSKLFRETRTRETGRSAGNNVKLKSNISSGEQLSAGNGSDADSFSVSSGKQLAAGNASDFDGTIASVDGQSITKKSRTITFGAVEIIQHPMPADGVAAKYDDMALCFARRQPRKARPCSKCVSILDEHVVTIMRDAGARRDAGEAALRLCHEPGVTWDNAGYAHVYAPRSKRDPNRRNPLTLRRETALTTLDSRWAKFLHKGEVPGSTGRTEAGSSLGGTTSMVRRLILAQASGIRVDRQKTLRPMGRQNQTMVGRLGMWLRPSRREECVRLA